MPHKVLRVVASGDSPSSSKPPSRKRARAAVTRVVNAFDTASSLARISLEAGNVERAARHLCDVAAQLRADLAVTAQVAARPSSKK